MFEPFVAAFGVWCQIYPDAGHSRHASGRKERKTQGAAVIIPHDVQGGHLARQVVVWVCCHHVLPGQQCRHGTGAEEAFNDS